VRLFDFDERLARIHDKDHAARATKEAERKAAKERTHVVALVQATPMDVDPDNMMAAMGFAGFGTLKK